VFLPQIVILFFFILTLEDFGYMARAAFLMDRIMGSAALMAAPLSRYYPPCAMRSPASAGHPA